MTTLRYEQTSHRLRVEGVCRGEDIEAVRDALDAFAPTTGGHLLVDLTAVTELDPVVAAELVAAARGARREGKGLTLVRKHRTPADDAIVAAEARRSGSA